MSNKAISQLSFIIFTLLLHSFVDSTVPGASFGEVCGSNDTRCDSQSFLTCVENICQCIKPNEMTFDKSHGKCLVLSGERCTYTAVKDLQEKKWTEKLDCVENSKCSNEGFCSCLDNYYENKQGFCVPKQMYGHMCSDIQKCREDKYLVCIDSTCKCNDTDTVFDPFQNQCVFKAGKSCLNNKPCANNAYCAGWPSQCYCRDNYQASKNGLCLVQYNYECNSQTPSCLEDLACINGKCSCPFPGHQIFKEDGKNKCISLLRGPCSENVDGNVLKFSCILGAECHEDKQTGINECRCSKGYIESENRTCAIEYGEKCESKNGKNPCDTVANLFCKDQKCVCPDFQVYNSNTFKCEGLVGEPCSLATATFDTFCVSGADCKRSRDDKLGNGVCRCQKDMIAESNRKCVVRKLEAAAEYP